MTGDVMNFDVSLEGTQTADQFCITLKEGPMATQGEVKIMDIPLNKIKLARNSRMNIEDGELAGLMQSIKETGLLQPIGVINKGSHYEICYGNRRFLASSKLGLRRIPAIVHKDKKASDIDLKNLTENIQRRNISLVEAGRYIDLLQKEGLSVDEISVRLGVAKTYVKSCFNAYSNVPKEFQDDLEVKNTNDRHVSPGKISITVANKIIAAGKTMGLSADDKKVLFKAAKSGKLNAEQVPKYAAAVKSGKKFEEITADQHVTAQFYLSQVEHAALYEKYIADGPFRSFSGLVVAILKGQKDITFKSVR